MKETLNHINPLDRYRIVDTKGKLIMKFRTIMAAKNWLKQNQKYYCYELRLEE